MSKKIGGLELKLSPKIAAILMSPPLIAGLLFSEVIGSLRSGGYIIDAGFGRYEYNIQAAFEAAKIFDTASIPKSPDPELNANVLYPIIKQIGEENEHHKRIANQLRAEGQSVYEKNNKKALQCLIPLYGLVVD